jgi:hypothetical protein
VIGKINSIKDIFISRVAKGGSRSGSGNGNGNGNGNVYHTTFSQ